MRRLLLAASLALPVAAGAQTLPYPARQADAVGRDTRAFSFYDRGPYKPGVPRPDALLGYEIGSLNTQHAEQQRVLLAIADAAKDRVRVEEIGSTVERRPMRLFIVSSPENIARLDAIRADLDALSDPRGKTQAQLDALAARVPAVVWISESVHGNEAPGFETVMHTLYQLAASDEPATVNALKNVIVVLNPSSNPDGHERFAVWYNSIHVGDPNNWSLEHDEPWSIQGRFNHYRFDMNRDVAATTQREPQALVRGMLRWHPMVAVDQHGQVSTYFFPPAARPVNANIGAQSEKWLDAMGRGNAKAFDKYGWMYYVRDQFDLGGPFYWDTWPSLTGATGMTYETDGGGWKGILWKREDGSLLSFKDGIAKHYVSALATIETTAGRAQERVKDYVAFRQAAVDAGRTGTMKRVVLVPGRDPARAAELVSALVRSGIEVRRASGAFSATRAHAYYDDATGARRFDAGAYVVDLAQPQGRLAKAFLEPADALDPIFAKGQVDKYRRNIARGRREGREGYEFYDVTAWSLPVAYGVESYWTEDAAPVGGDLLAMPAEEPSLPAAREAARRSGGELLAVDVGGGIVAGRGAQSAYLFTSERSGAPRLAWALMDEGFRVGIALQPIESGDRDWPRGTYVVRVSRNDTTLTARIDALAREAGVEVTGVNSAYTAKGQYGIGSEPVQSLVAPKIGMVGDEGIAQTAYGAMWWSLERRYGIRFTPVNWSGLSSSLDELNVLVIPSASPGELSARLGKDGAEQLKAWVQRGGTLVTMGGASAWAAREDVGLTSARAVGGGGGDSTAKDAGKRDSARMTDPALADLTGLPSPSAANDRPQPLPGTNFDAVLDRTHWLTVGYERPRLTAMLTGSTFLKPSREGSNVAVFPTSGLLTRGGFTWPDNTERLLRGTSLVIEEPVGGGHVVLFSNEPMFRGWWRALDKLVLNAMVLGPGM